jgi:2-phosphosulfolactate phosphatase
MASHDQHGADVRFDWGAQGLESLLGGGVRTIVIVDVLRFSTAVDVACGRGAAVTPFADGATDAVVEATRRGAVVAGESPRGGDTTVPSLSPVSLRNLTPADHIVLPSVDGGLLACRAADAGVAVLAGCLRNAAAVAGAITEFPAGVVAAGERWVDGSLRVAVEDAWGAGAIIRGLSPPDGPDPGLGLLAMFSEALGGEPQAPAGRNRSRILSPEAAWAAANLPRDLPALLPRTASGRELTEAGWSLDIEVAAALDVSRRVPTLDAQGTFRA